jgi:hypothetical protein
VEKEAPQRRTFRIEQSPLEKVRLWVEIIAFAAAGCWALYTFVYQTRIAPAFVPAHEVFSVSAQRLVSTASGSIQRVQLTIRNDGTVDVDTAALAVNVFGTPASGLRWQTISSGHLISLHDPKLESLRVLQSYGRLFDGAVDGQRDNTVLLHPGDSFDYQFLVNVPREDHLLLVGVNTVYARYPIRPRIAVQLARRSNGAIDFTGTYENINFVHYFGV